MFGCDLKFEEDVEVTGAAFDDNLRLRKFNST